MTHNLRTPIASIGAAASALRSPSVPADTRAALVDSIRDEGDRLDRLVTKVLDLGRLRSGTVEPHFETIDLAELVRRAVRRLRHLAADRDVRLAVTGAEVDAEVDAELIEVVVVNLLENALRFAPTTTEILITVAPAPATARRTAGHRPRSGRRTRAPGRRSSTSSPASTGNGSGVGLAIARAFVTLHDGRLWYEDTPGGGATFAFADPGTAAAMSTVMVVEDDAALRLALATNLESDGYTVVPVGSGEECLARAGVDDPDLVLLDLGLPGRRRARGARRGSGPSATSRSWCSRCAPVSTTSSRRSTAAPTTTC